MLGSNYRLLAAGLAGLVCVWTLAGGAAEDEGLWQTDFEAARAKAQAEKKLMLVDFTGSDWCGWCIRLKEEVFDKEAFQKEAPQKFVLVELDFPRQKELSAELRAQNEQLREKFGVTGFPTILLLDAEGRLVARTGYRAGGPDAYVTHLNEFVAAHEAINAMRTQLASVQGIDRATLLDRLIEAYGKLDVQPEENEAWTDEIIALDPDNAAGLKIKHQFRQLIAAADELKAQRRFEEAKAAYEKALELPGVAGPARQDAWFARGECFFYAHDFAGVITCLKQAVEAAPDSPKASAIQGMAERFAPIAAAQEAAAKAKEQLETAQGLDRARALDQLLEARGALARVAPDPDLAQNAEAWAREIMELDAANEAGLKSKYGVQVLLADARQALQDQKLDEAHAALDKALAIPGVTGEPLLELQHEKARCYAAQGQFEKALEACQKALEASPTSSRARGVRAQMQQAQAELDKQKAKQASAPAASPSPTASPQPATN